MKRYWIAAGTLLLSTSALAVAADTKDMTTGAANAQAATKTFAADWDKALLAAKADTDKAKVEIATVDSFDKPVAIESGAKFQTASADAFGKPLAAESWAKVETASADSFAKPLTTDASAKLAMASFDEGTKPLAADASGKFETASADGFGKPQADYVGTGGPIEADGDAASLFTPQPATQNYPPCSPGPGDDRCIQLYEPGVRAQLASWNRPTGGLLDANQQTAMGGPLEPVDGMTGKPSEAELASVYKPESEGAMGGPFEAADEDVAKPTQAELASVYKADSSTALGGPYEPADESLAMNGDGAVDTGIGETSDSAVDTQLASHDSFTGVGGPIEAQSGYPPCSPGPGDDRCIQLYEAGVTGAGN